MAASDYGFTTPSGNDYIRDGDNAISQNAEVTAGALDKLLPVVQPTGTSLDDIATTTVRLVFAFGNNPGRPPGETGGVLYSVTNANGSTRMQMWYTLGVDLRQWLRFRGSTSWTPWKRTDAGEAVAALQDQITANSPQTAGTPLWRVLPLALTAGGPPATWGTTSGGLRHRFRVPVDVGRYRIHARSINPRFGAVDAGALTVSGAWVGPQGATPGRWSTTPTKVANGSTAAAGEEWVSPWITTPIAADTWHTLGLAWSSTVAPQVTRTTAWTTAAGDAGTPAATTTITNAPPLDVWLECEVPSTVRATAYIGDSLSVGIGSTYGVFDSWPAQLAAARGEWPILLGASGDGFSGWLDATHYKWTRFAGLARPDSVVLALGPNDVFGTASLETLKLNALTVADLARARFASAVYAATILPREGVTGAQETTRRSFNAWLKTLPADLDVRDTFDIVPAVSADDETLRDEFDADGIHLNTNGYSAVAAAVTRPLAPSKAAARAAIGAAADLDTGWRRLAAPDLTGDVLCTRAGTAFTLMLSNVRGFSGTYTFPDALPVGMRPRVSTSVAIPAGGAVTVNYAGVITVSGVPASTSWVTCALTYVPGSLATPPAIGTPA